MLNKIVLQGRLGSDPEMRVTGSGKPVADFTLAVDRDFKNQNGEKETDWIDVVIFGNSAKFVCDHFTKGRMAIVSGRLQIRNWTDKEGNKRRAAEVVADNVYFGDSKRDTDGIMDNMPVPVPFRENDDGYAMLEEDDEQLPF